MRFGELSRHGSSLVRRPRTWSPLRAAIRSHPPVAGLWPSHTRTFALREGRRVIGFAQTTLRSEPDQWELMYLVLESPAGTGSPPDVAERQLAQLLSGICEAAEAEGTTRLFARLPEGAATVECVRRWGFAKVLTEHTYVAPIQGRSTPPRLGLRAQRPADAYPLWQLYRASTPAVVQTAEALSSRQWDLPLPLLPRWLLLRRRTRGWVVPGAERPLAWVQLAMDGYKSAAAEIMIDPDSTDLVEDLLDYLVAQVGSGNTLLTCTVREHQTALRFALEDRGFGLAASSDLVVKRLAIPVFQRGMAPALEKVAA